MPTGRHNGTDAVQAHSKQDDGVTAYDARDKDALARVWDTIVSSGHAGRSETQDRVHSAIVFVVIIAIVTSIAVLGAWLVHDYTSYRDDHIFVPATTYGSDQAASVESQLSGMGFVDMSEDDDGITAYGTHEMCDAWRSSYWDRNVSNAVADIGTSSLSGTMSATHMASGIMDMRHSDDWTTVTITTLTTDPSVSVIGYMIESDTSMADAIDAAANWCAVLHDGQRLHVSFAGKDGGEYLAIDTDTATDIIAQLQEQGSGGAGGTDANADADATNGSDDDASESDAGVQ